MTSPSIYSGGVVRWAAAASLAMSLAASPALAQQAGPATIRLLPEDQERGQYGHQHNFYFLAPGKTGEDYQSAGFWGGKLRPYLAGNTQALTALNAYKRQKTLFLADRILLVGSAGLYGSQVFAHGDPVYFNSAQQVAAGLAAFSVLSTIFINRHTNEHFKDAVEAYNGSLPANGHGSVWPRLRPAGLGLASVGSHPVLALRWQL